jgi:sugar phosphate isomerase/epimerase
MKLAIQEDMLPGRTPEERFGHAKDLGFDGVELWADGLEDRLYDVAMTLNELELPVASVHLGQSAGYLSPELTTREAAISTLREAMALAVDLHVEHVTFVPQWGALRTPDLTPHRSREELASELMVWLLRTVSDLAYALGTTLHMQPRNRYETEFLTSVGQAVQFCKAIKDNPHVRVAPNLFDIALEEIDPIAALRDHADYLGYVYLADSNGRLPGQGLLDFEAVAGALHEAGYDGWLCLATGHPIASQERQYQIYDALPQSLQLLQQVGLR